MIHKKSTDELVAERPSATELEKLPRYPISVVVDNVRSLDNVGLIFRLCEVARLDHLYLTGYTGHPKISDDTRPPYIIARHERRINKTAVYAVPHQPWTYTQNPVEVVQRLKQEGRHIVALEQTDQSRPFHQVDYPLPLALIVGHERQGVRPELLELADTIVEIPIHGHGNSHNVAIATSIIVYQILTSQNIV